MTTDPNSQGNSEIDAYRAILSLYREGGGPFSLAELRRRVVEEQGEDHYAFVAALSTARERALRWVPGGRLALALDNVEDDPVLRATPTRVDAPA